MKRRRGMSLAETIVSLFILVGAFLTVIGLFHSGLRYSREAFSQQTAVLVAENKLEEIRDWAATSSASTYNFDDWAAYLGPAAADPNYPDYLVKVEAVDYAVDSPNSGFGAAYNTLSNPRRLATSVRKVRVTVTWKRGLKSLSLVTFVGDPERLPRAANPVVLSPTGALPGSLARDASQQYNVYAYDATGRPIRDLMFSWAIKPGQSNAQLDFRRDGSSANVTNQLLLPLQPPSYLGGSVILQARTTYRGLPLLGESAALPLDP